MATKNKSVKFLQERADALRDVIAVIEDMMGGKGLCTACKEHGLDWNSVNNLLRSKMLAGISLDGNLVPYAEAAVLEMGPYESLYFDLFGKDASLRGVLPADVEESVSYVLATLTARQQQVVSMYYGLDGESARTLAQIGEELGVAAEGVRQTKVLALRRMRQPFRAEVLVDGLAVAQARKEAVRLETEAKSQAIIDAGRENAERIQVETLAKIQSQDGIGLLSDLLKNTLIANMGLSTRAKNCLLRAGYSTALDIVWLDMSSVLKIRNLGRDTAAEIQNKMDSILAPYGMRWEDVRTKADVFLTWRRASAAQRFNGGQSQ